MGDVILNITPIIKRTRVHTERYDVCPHCMREIGEKEIFIDSDDYVYHSCCREKGPIDKIDPDKAAEDFQALFLNPVEVNAVLASSNSIVKTASTGSRFGTIEKNIAGKDYQFKWTAAVGEPGDPVTDVVVAQPADLPDDLWAQVQGGITEQAIAEATKMMHETDMLRTEFGSEDGMTGDWLTAAINSMTKTSENTQSSDTNLSKEAAKKKTIKLNPEKNKPASNTRIETVDNGFLADGLGAFVDAFVNYHAGLEGPKIAKWIVSICRDPRFAKIVPLLEQFHKLPSEIYQGILEIAKNDAKVASVVYRVMQTGQAVQRNTSNQKKIFV